MSDWYLQAKEYKQAIKDWENCFNSNDGSPKLKISEISDQIEFIFNYPYFKKFSNTFIEDIIWIGSQARIFHDNDLVTKCVDTFLKQVAKILNDEEKFEINLNTIIGITVLKIKRNIPYTLPSIRSCLTKKEVDSVNKKLDSFEFKDLLNEDAYELDKSKQMQLINRYSGSPSLKELSSKVEILLDVATGNSEGAAIACAAINYLLATNDVVSDDIGILGLVDDMYAIDYAIQNINPKNLLNRLVNKHNINYPSFDLPIIDSKTPLSLINLENIVKASYTKIDANDSLKRLLIVPKTGPLHILSAIGKAICNRIDGSQPVTIESFPFKSGDKILIGEIPAISHGKNYMKKVFVEYDSQVSRAPSLHYVKTAGKGEKETIPKMTLYNSSLCLDKNQKISSRSDLKKFKREEGKKIIPWGSVEFSTKIKLVPAEKKIFIFCKKNNLDAYLNEKIYGETVKSWFGLRYFNKDYNFKDHMSTFTLFPEPMFYSASNKDIAMEMIRGRWDENSIAREPDLIIIKEPSWLDDLEFLKLLRKCTHDIVIFNDFFRQSNSLIKKYGFEEISAKPEALIPVNNEKGESINQSLIERFLLKSEPFKIIPEIIKKNALDEIYTLLRKTNFTNDDFIFKYQLQNLLKKIRKRIIPHTPQSSKELTLEFSKIINELTFLSKINHDYLKLLKLIQENTEYLMSFDRSKALSKCIAKIEPNKKTRIVIHKDQLREARKTFSEKNENLDFILTNELENQKDLDNLIIPFFLGSEYSTKLRNFKYADNHIFLLSESELNVHKLMQKRDKNLFNSLYSNNSATKNETQKISYNEVELAVSQIDPSSNIFQHSINIINDRFQSANKDENIESRIFSLENEQIIILPTGGSSLVCDSDLVSNSPTLGKVSTFNIGDRLIIPKSFSGHDLLEAVIKSDSHQYDEYVEINKKASAWKEILNEYKLNNGLDSSGLHNELQKVGIKRNIGTIRSWINDPDTVAPKNRDDIITKIFTLEHSCQVSKDSCLNAIKVIYNARENARKMLVSNLERKTINYDQSSLRVAINEMTIDFKILKIESIADVSVQFKYLYHLRSYEDINAEGFENGSID